MTLTMKPMKPTMTKPMPVSRATFMNSFCGTREGVRTRRGVERGATAAAVTAAAAGCWLLLLLVLLLPLPLLPPVLAARKKLCRVPPGASKRVAAAPG